MKDTKNAIYDIISKEFSVPFDEISDDKGPGDISGWDSIGQLRLIMSIEQKFNYQLSVDEVVSINSVKDIIDVISKSVNNIEKNDSDNVDKLKMEISINPIRFPYKTFGGAGSITAINSYNYKKIAIVSGESMHSEINIKVVCDNLPNEIEIKVFKKESGEPTIEDIKKLNFDFREFNPDHIIALGGGSVIDTAKLLWLSYENTNLDLDGLVSIDKKISLRKKATFSAIPTIFGSGAEVSSAIAFRYTDSISKTILFNNLLLPDNVILDANFLDFNKKQLLYPGAFDAFTHALEGFVSVIENSFLDNNVFDSIKVLLSIFSDLKNDKQSIKTVENLCYVSYHAGIIQNHCSVGITHSFAHQLSSFGVSHGVANALFLSSVIEFNKHHTNKYEILVNSIGIESIEYLVTFLDETLLKSDVIPSEDTIMLIVENKNAIINGAMEDVTFRTNPTLPSLDEMSKIFDIAIEKINFGK